MPAEVTVELAARVRERRLDRGWSRAELAARAGVALETLRKFERTGQVSLERLVRIAIALGSQREFDGLFAQRTVRSLDELTHRTRRRGRSLGGAKERE